MERQTLEAAVLRRVVSAAGGMFILYIRRARSRVGVMTSPAPWVSLSPFHSHEH